MKLHICTVVLHFKHLTCLYGYVIERMQVWMNTCIMLLPAVPYFRSLWDGCLFTDRAVSVHVGLLSLTDMAGEAICLHIRIYRRRVAGLGHTFGVYEERTGKHFAVINCVSECVCVSKTACVCVSVSIHLYVCAHVSCFRLATLVTSLVKSTLRFSMYN